MPEVNPTLGSAAIAGPSPAGENVRYDALFEALAAEIQKLESPTGGAAAVNWKTVVNNSTEILANKSKDLLVAAYLCSALFHTKGYAALADGISVMVEMIKAHWENLWPELKRMRARTAAVQWLVERVAPEIERRPEPAPTERDGLAAISVALEQLSTLAAKFEGDVPDLGALTRAVRDKLSTQDTQPAGEVAPAGDGGQPMAGAAAPGGPVGSRAEALRRLQEVADFLRRTEPHSPVSYLVQRAVKWGNLPLEEVIKELVKDSGARDAIYETLGLPKPPTT